MPKHDIGLSLSDVISDIGETWTVNVAAIAVSLSDIEMILRILGLILAALYTSVKLYKALREKPSREGESD